MLGLLLNHGYSSGVVHGSSYKVLLLHAWHAGHRVVLRQRAVVDSWSGLVFKLTATVHPLCGEIKKQM